MADTTKILVIEDDPSLRRVLIERITEEGYTVIEATDGVQGLDIALREHPRLILLDVFMPHMDGVSMLTKLRGSGPWGKHVKVIVLTNAGDMNTMQRVIGLGATDYLTKSEWGLDAIVKKIAARIKEPTESTYLPAGHEQAQLPSHKDFLLPSAH